MMEIEKLKRKDNSVIHIAKSIAIEEKAKLLLIHGYGEYSGRYLHFIEHCNLQGISVYTFDLIGHGHSDGLRAYVPSQEILISHVDAIRTPFQLGTDSFLMGHSMGGLIAVGYCLIDGKISWKGLITSAAALAVDPEMSPLLQKLAPIIAAILPKLKTTPLDITFLTRSDDVRTAYLSDPLVYTDGMRARTAALTLRMIKKVNKSFNKISMPLLAMHGSADKVTMPSGTKKLYKEASSNDKTLNIYDKLYHELVNEPERKMVMKDISKWILERA